MSQQPVEGRACEEHPLDCSHGYWLRTAAWGCLAGASHPIRITPKCGGLVVELRAVRKSRVMARGVRKWLPSPVPLRLRLSLGKAPGDGVLKKIFGGILVKKLVVVSPGLPTMDPLSSM